MFGSRIVVYVLEVIRKRTFYVIANSLRSISGRHWSKLAHCDANLQLKNSKALSPRCHLEQSHKRGFSMCLACLTLQYGK